MCVRKVKTLARVSAVRSVKNKDPVFFLISRGYDQNGRIPSLICLQHVFI